MPIPILNTTTSILGYKQYESWEYQPFVSGVAGTATWACTGLPAGMSIDTGTGLISGAATVAGVFIATLGVTDTTNGAATPIPLTIGIEPAAGSLRSGADLLVDLQSGEVTLSAAPVGLAGAPLFSVKEGDDLLIYVQFRRGETVVDLGAVTEMTFGLKELEPEGVLVLGGGEDTGSDGTPFKYVGAEDTYVMHVAFSGSAFGAALANYESDGGTKYLALCEITWVEPNPTSGDRVGPATLRRTSKTFLVEAVRDLVD